MPRSNVLLTEGLRACIGDLGVAQVLHSAGGPAAGHSRTHAGEYKHILRRFWGRVCCSCMQQALCCMLLCTPCTPKPPVRMLITVWCVPDKSDQRQRHLRGAVHAHVAEPKP